MTTEVFLKPFVHVAVYHTTGCSTRSHVQLCIPADTPFSSVLDTALQYADGALPPAIVAAVNNNCESLVVKVGESRQDSGITMMLAAPIQEAFDIGCPFISYTARVTSAASTPDAPRMLYGLQQTAVATRGLDCFPQSRPGEDGDDCARAA